MFLFGLLVVGGLVFYFMTPEERLGLRHEVMGPLSTGIAVAGAYRPGADDPFYVELRARMRRPLVTYALVAANVAVFLLMLFGAGSLADPATLAAWGGNFGPRTTDGERWRVFTSIFVHRGVLHLLVNMAALAQLGLIVERIAGTFTFATIFVAAGVLSSIMSGAASPMTVSVGTSGAVFGLYGLLFAATLRGLLNPPAIRIPWRVLKTLPPVAAVFVLYWLVADEPAIAAKVGLCTGVVGGFALTRSVRDDTARLRRLAALGTATAVIVLMSAMALRAVTDVRPTIAAIVANEERTAAVYDAAVVKFRAGRANLKDLAQIIDQTVLPDVRRARERVRVLTDVPAEDEALVGDAQQYLRLREESWRIRTEALRKSNMRMLREADGAEQSSLQVFEKLKSRSGK
jgi:membrane associated rhomboid family serine protease